MLQYDMTFMDEWGGARVEERATEARAVIGRCSELIRAAEAVVVQLGGKAGRLGETVVASALLEGILLALRYLGKAGTPVTILVDEGAAILFKEQIYQQTYWPTIHVRETMPSQDSLAETLEKTPGETIVGVDLHGGHDGMPELIIQQVDVQTAPARYLATLVRLFRVGVRSYARRGSERRYADFIEDLFDLAPGTLEGRAVQPRLRLDADDEARATRVERRLKLRSEALRVVCFFQSVVIAKCYCRWDEVMERFCRELAARFPGKVVDFLILCGPDEMHPEGLRQEDMRADFGAFRGTNENARVLIHATTSLRELAALTSHAHMAFANDTGPGHIAGALGIPTITPYLPGTLYSMRVWSSSLAHRGVTLEPNPFSYQQIESAILWDKTSIIDSIPPEKLAEQALSCLPWR